MKKSFIDESNIVILQYQIAKFKKLIQFEKMGITKTEHFTEEQNEISSLLKALAHPARIAIVEYLLSVDTCICNDIVAEIGLAQATVSQHLKELKNAGLIKGRVEGNAICYCIDENGFEKVKSFFQNVNEHIEKKKTDCC